MTPPIIENLFGQLDTSLREDAARPLFAEKSPVYIYGAGNVGKDVCRLLTARGVRVVAFLDRNAKPGAAWEGTPILLPDDPAISHSEREQGHVVVGIFNRDVEIPPVQKLLGALGYGRVTTFLDLHSQFPTELGDRFWLTSRQFYPPRKDEIARGYELWSDDASRDLYEAVLKLRFFKDYSVLHAPNLTDQYFPTGLAAWPEPIRLVDCGAYDGDTLQQLVDRRLEMGAVAAFEPDPLNYQKLAQAAQAHFSDSTATVSLFPCGVSSKTSQIRFSSGQGSSSCVSDNGDIVIQCVALDEALPAFRPTLIKMDIEGAEVDALLGARRMIEKHRPGLALSVYHRADHLWTIPLLAQSWLKSGRHYLRAHAHSAFELIYYWMPR
jgi:FkbM family methyltransferase